MLANWDFSHRFKEKVANKWLKSNNKMMITNPEIFQMDVEKNIANICLGTEQCNRIRHNN